MTTTYSVPVYPRPCLASDEDNNAIYLLGVSPTGIGKMESSYISLANPISPSVRTLGSQVDIDSWATNAPKACFTYPSDVHPNSPIMLVQYGAFKTYMSIMTADGQFTQATYFDGTAFMSPRQFSMVGDSGDFAWFVSQTNRTDPVTKSNWFGVRLNFTTGLGSLIDPDIGTFPTSTPLVTVGTYGTTPTTAWQGSNIVFDTQGGGLVYPSQGLLQASGKVITLSAAKSVAMNGISLTADSIPVTMELTGYILDKAADGSTAIYSITPTQSNTLNRVTRTGGAPPFNPSMVAVAMNKLIVTYSMVNASTAYFNTFDTATNTWAGLGLVGTPGGAQGSGDGSSKSTPIGAIVGGVVGGLVVIALVAFLFIRNRRQKRAGKDVEGDSSNKSGPDQNTPHVYTYVPEIVPAPIVQQPVFFDPQAATIVAAPTYYDPNTPAVYDPNANIYDQNTHIYDSGLNSYEAPGAGAYPPPPSSNVYTTAPPGSHPSPYQDPTQSPYSSDATKTGSPAGPQFVGPESYPSPKNIGSPQYVEAREPFKNSSEPEYYRP